MSGLIEIVPLIVKFLRRVEIEYNAAKEELGDPECLQICQPGTSVVVKREPKISLDYSWLLSLAIHKLLESPEAEDLAEVLLRQRVLADISPWWGKPEDLNSFHKNRRAILGVMLLPILTGLQSGISVFSDSGFAHSYVNDLKSHAPYNQRHITIVPLVGLRFASEFVRLSDSFCIAPFDEKLSSGISNRSNGFLSEIKRVSEQSLPIGTNAVSHALCSVSDVPYSEGRFSSNSTWEVDLLVSSLLLSDVSFLKLPIAFRFSLDTLDPMIISQSSLPDFFPRSHILRPLELDDQKLQEVLRRFSQLRSLYRSDQASPIFLALNRFTRTYERTDEADSIVDLVISLEASVLHGQKDELSYRLKMRSAALMWANNPQEVMAIVGALYDARSKIVHRGHTSKDALSKQKIDKVLKENPVIFVLKAQKIVRSILCMIIENMANGESLESCCQKADNDIVNAIVTYKMANLDGKVDDEIANQ